MRLLKGLVLAIKSLPSALLVGAVVKVRRFIDWLKRLLGLGAWHYYVQAVRGENCNTSPVYCVGRRKQMAVAHACVEYLATDGCWLQGRPPFEEEDRALISVAAPSPATGYLVYPVFYSAWDRAEDHAHRLRVGIPDRWSIIAGLLAVAGVATGIAVGIIEAVCRLGGCSAG